MREIGLDVKDAVSQLIRNSTWMDEPTKETALKKLAFMEQEFIEPSWYSDEAINRYYEGVSTLPEEEYS